MKKFYLFFLAVVPFFAVAQVANPETLITTTQAGFTGTASSFAGEGPVVNALDNNTGTFWTSDWTTGAPFPHWYMVNMGGVKTINGIYLVARQGRSFNDDNIQECTIATSNDGASWQQQGGTINPKDVFEIPGKQYLKFSAPVTCAYYRINITNNYGTFTGHYVNAATAIAETGAITGIVTPDATSYDRTSWVATSSSVNAEGPVKSALDQNNATFWTTAWGQTNNFSNCWYQVDMGVVQPVNQVSIVQRGNGTTDGRNARMTKGYISYGNNSDGTNGWTSLPSGDFLTADGSPIQYINLPAGLSFRYFRVNPTENLAVKTNGAGADKTVTLAEVRAHYNTTLPVNLISFSATANKNVIDLNWITASESNSDQFIITRSTDGQSFTKIGNVKASGNSNSIKKYHFTDLSPVTGINYYQLEQVDIDGRVNKSGVKSVMLSNSNKITLNVKSLSSTGIYLEIYTSAATSGKVFISNLSGQRITSQGPNFKGRKCYPANSFE